MVVGRRGGGDREASDYSFGWSSREQNFRGGFGAIRDCAAANPFCSHRLPSSVVFTHQLFGATDGVFLVA